MVATELNVLLVGEKHPAKVATPSIYDADMMPSTPSRADAPDHEEISTWLSKGSNMRLAALSLVALIGALHSYIAWFEIFAWESRGPQVFSSLDAGLFPKTVAMAANQGIYNAFLAAGLFWSLLIKDQRWQIKNATCFLIFVCAAGVFGAATVTMKTLYIQTVPALITLAILHLNRLKSR